MLSIEQIRDAVRAADIGVEADGLSADKTFEEQGLDSLDVFNLFLELEKVSGVQVPDEDMEGLQSIDAVAKYFANR